MVRWLLVAVAVLGVGGSALAQGAGLPSSAVLAEQAGRRFPQAVRVGDLVGRAVLAPLESQPVLGRVVGVARGGGGVEMLMRVGGVLGFGARVVAVPVDAVALLGEYVAVVGYTPEQVGGLPAAVGEAALPPDESIRVGVVRPFH